MRPGDIFLRDGDAVMDDIVDKPDLQEFTSINARFGDANSASLFWDCPSFRTLLCGVNLDTSSWTLTVTFVHILGSFADSTAIFHFQISFVGAF